MQKGKSVIGKDVLSLASGARIHSVKDILIGADNDQVVALLVDEGGLLGTSTVVPFEAISSIGRDAIVVEQDEAVVAASSDPEVKAILNRTDKLLGKTVYTEDGKKMGSIADLYFDDRSGRITGFEISGGTLGDLARGPSYLATEEVRIAGTDAVFISSSGGEALEGQVGGLQGALAKAGEKVGSAADDAKKSLAENPSATPEERLVGKRSAADVTDERGSIVVASGQRITAEQVERAKSTGNLQLLYEAADAGDARDREDQTKAAAEQVGDTASDLWDKFTAKLGEVTDAAGQRVDEQQTRSRLASINEAVGRPVTKVILDRDDEVILDLGDIITHQAVQRANDAGLLDTLLGSAYKGDVSFERDEMKVKIVANSTVEKASGGAAIVEELAAKVETAEQERASAAERRKRETETTRERKAKERESRADARDQAAKERAEAEEARRVTVSASSSDNTTPDH